MFGKNFKRKCSKTLNLIHQNKFSFAMCSTPIGLEDVSKYPILFAELIGFGWTMDELTKLAGGNLLRVFKEVETIRDKMREEKIQPNEDIFANRMENPHKCQSN